MFSQRGGKKLFIQTFVILSLMRLGLLLLSFRQLQELLHKLEQPSFLTFDARYVSLGAIVRAVERSSRYSPGEVKCLARAMTAALLMNIYSFPHEIKIGVAKGAEGQIEAHAWVECAGQVVLGNLPDLSRYTAMTASKEGIIL